MTLKHDLVLFSFWFKAKWRTLILPNAITCLSILAAGFLLSLSTNLKKPLIAGLDKQTTFYNVYRLDRTNTIGFTFSQLDQIRGIDKTLSSAGIVLPISIPMTSPNASDSELAVEIISTNLMNESGLKFAGDRFLKDLYIQGGIVVSHELANKLGGADYLIGKSIKLKTEAGSFSAFVAGVTFKFKGFVGNNTNLFMSPALLKTVFNATSAEMHEYIDSFVRNTAFLILPSKTEQEIQDAVFKLNFNSNMQSGILYSKYISKNIEQIKQLEGNISKLSNISILLFFLVVFSLLRQFYQLLTEDLQEQKTKWMLGATAESEYLLDNFKIIARYCGSMLFITLIVLTLWLRSSEINISGITLPFNINELIKTCLLLHIFLHLTYISTHFLFNRFNNNTQVITSNSPAAEKRLFSAMFVLQMVFCFIMSTVAIGYIINLHSNIPDSKELNESLVVTKTQIKKNPSRLKIEAEPFSPVYNITKELDIAWSSRSPFSGRRDLKEYYLNSEMTKSIISDTWYVTEEYFNQLNIPLIKGKYGNVGNYIDVVVNQSFVNKYQINIGEYFFYRTFTVSANENGYTVQDAEASPLRVVGVVSDINLNSIKYAIEPTVYQFISSTSNAKYALYDSKENKSFRFLLNGKASFSTYTELLTLYNNDLEFIRFSIIACILALLISFLVAYISIQSCILEYVHNKLPEMQIKIAIGSTPQDSIFELVHMMNILLGISILLGGIILLTTHLTNAFNLYFDIIEITISLIVIATFYACSCLKPIKKF